MISALKKKLLGVSFPQEYLCLAKDLYVHPFRVEIEAKKLDVSENHMMLGYSPLIIGIPMPPGNNYEKVTLNFLFEGKVIASINMNQIHQVKAGNSILHVYEGVRVKHEFVPKFSRLLLGARGYLRSLKKGNVRLKGNIYDQVRVAYSVPREISIVTTGSNGYYNIFPTDLHGRINKEYYADSLRISGKAGKQVEDSGHLVLSRIDASYYKQSYTLGKNHMADLKPIGEDEDMQLSEKLSLPVAAGAISYLELERIAGVGFDKGVHRVHIFRIINEKFLRNGNPLAHIHNYAAAWRENHGIKTDYLFR
jgi:hypothetical protein